MNIILDRKLGANYPISIGTSLALETIGNPETPEVGHVVPRMTLPFTKYGVLAVSINTLIMNLIESMDSHNLPPPTAKTFEFIMAQIDQELGVITEIAQKANSRILIRPYINTFSILNKLLEKINKRRSFSGYRAVKNKLYINTLRTGILLGYSVWNTNVKMRLMSPGFKVLALTSLPIDIVGNERAVSILEPHTGAVRMYDTFYKKLYPVPKADMSIVPFNISTHLLFGDKHMVVPDPIKIRRQFLQIAEQNNFLYNTQTSIILDAISVSGYKELKESMLRFRNL